MGRTNRIVSFLMVLALCASLVCLPAAAEGAVYRFSASDLTALADKEALTGATFADSYISTFGELVKRTGSDGSVKSVEVGKNGASGLTFTAGGTAHVTVEFSSTGGSNSSTVGLWNEAGDTVPNNEGVTVVTGTDKTALTWTALPAGTYKVVSPDASEHNRGARVYSLTVEDSAGARAPRKAWSEVAGPVITDVKAEAGAVTVTYAMDMGYDGADQAVVTMSDPAAGPEALASVESDDGQAVFAPAKSGKYVFTVTALRAGEADKSAASEAVDFVLPLAVPAVTSAASTGGGSISVVWKSVDEATGYNVYLDGVQVNNGPVEGTEFTASGLAVGSEHAFAVAALRGGEESARSEAVSAVATLEAQRAWSFATFGASTKPDKNYYEGDLNRDGKVTVISTGGAGKILEASSDGIAFYYTAVPVDKNFTLRAHAHVNSWENKSYQNGFGVAALDRIGEGSAEVWNNSMLVGGMRYAYFYDPATGTRYAEADPTHHGDQYKMRLGVSALYRSGVTWDGLEAMGGAITFPPGFSSWNQTLESFAAAEGKAPGTYNLIANGAEGECDDLSAMTADFILEVQRNNTGYFGTYYDMDGNIIGRHKTYDPTALDQLDSENVYVGFFTSRLMDATFDQVELTVNDPADDPAPEAKPKSQLVPKLVIHSAEFANDADYDLILTANVAGQVHTTLNGGSGPSGRIDAADRCDIPLKLDPGANDVSVTFLPDPDQSFDDPDLELASAEAVRESIAVDYDTRFAGRKVLYVAPSGTPDGEATQAAPLDIQTAVNKAAPGQIILVGEGTYPLSVLTIQKGINGKEGSPIYLVADPAAKTRPVLDFGNTGKGVTLTGDWWYIYGLDFTRATNEGINIGGSHNVLDQVVTHHNQATGLQISRESRADNKLAYWPSHNLILNCTAHHNVDPGYTDADGFGAKLTCGEGNVFDGCLSYRNSDDGWDLYAKAETGSIGKVTIQNCVSYLNGYLDDGTPGGDGNGFKMGGESITGYHELHNSVSFFNKNSGVTTNSCPDLQLFDVTLFDNDHLNVNFYTKLAKNTDFGATGVLSVKTSHNVNFADQFAPTGSQDPAKVLNDANYFWDGDSASKNASGAAAGLDSFVSTDFSGSVPRRADGTLDLGDFLKLTGNAPAGANLAGRPSLDVTALLAGAVTTEPTAPAAPAEPAAPAQPEAPATPAQPAAPAAGSTYTVKKGDNLWRIAQRFYGDGSKFGLIFNANLDQLKSPDRIDIGQVLVIPAL